MTVVVLVGRGRSSVCGSPCVTFCQDDCSCAGRERKVECVWLSLCDILSG